MVSPCDDTVRTAWDGLKDLTPPRLDRQNVTGNHVVFACGAVDVVPGVVGNSGDTTEPHLHIRAVYKDAGEAAFWSGMPPSPGERPARLMVRESSADGVFRSEAEDLRQVTARPVDPAVDGAHGDLLTGDDLFIAQAFRTDHQENLALLLG